MTSNPGSAEAGGRYVFVSYSRHDRAYVDNLVAHLRSFRIRTWVDTETDYGASWPRVVRDRVDGCCALVVVMTPASEDSEWVRREIIRAQQQSKTLLPLLLDGLGFFELNTTQHEDVSDGRMPTPGFIQRLEHLTDPTPVSSPMAEETLATSQDWLDEAARLTGLRNWPGALAAADRAVGLDPASASAIFYRGWALIELGRHREALNAAEENIELDPANAYAHNNRATALRHLGRDSDALVAVDRAIELDMTYAFAHNGRALTLINLGQWAEALAAVNQAIHCDSDSGYIFETKGQVLNGLGRHHDALDVLNQAIDLEPKLGWAHYNRGRAFSALGRHQEALESYRRADDFGLL